MSHINVQVVPQDHLSVEDLSDTPFVLQSVANPTKCLHLIRGLDSCSNGDAVILATIVNGNYPPQEWFYDGKLLRWAKCLTKCIHAASEFGKTLDGAHCCLWDVQDGDFQAQEWTIVGNHVRSATHDTRCLRILTDDAQLPRNGDPCVVGEFVAGGTSLQDSGVPTLDFSNYKALFLRKEVNGHALSCCKKVAELTDLGVDIHLKAMSLCKRIQQLAVTGVPTALFEHELHPPLPKRGYRLQSVMYPSMCLQLKSGDYESRNGDRLVLREIVCTAFPPQVWIWDGKHIRSANDRKKGIHINDVGPAVNGDIVHLWDYGRSSRHNEEWLFDGKLIRSVKNPMKCIRLKQGNRSVEGDECHLWDIVHDRPYPPQEWKLVPDENFPLK
ncbi:hypothetical protein ACHHYP_20228 [Achlya hypogyna]|uniref:Uncharacterized protein n=1 Tax=Achlya hypogyna TaxID=1202772 RepID=A0A1V9YX55_ACHHY|nr:hypothetical protein ACHHYP_20228 [Achlya hypogyna]